MDPKVLSVHGKFRRTNSEFEGFHSSFGIRIGPNFRFFLFRLKSVGKAYQLEANQLREGILTRRYRRKMSKASDIFISEADEKLATGRYSAQEFLQIVSHVTEKSFEKNGRWDKKSGKYWKWRALYDLRRSPRMLWNRMRWRWDSLYKMLRVWIGEN